MDVHTIRGSVKTLVTSRAYQRKSSSDNKLQTILYSLSYKFLLSYNEMCIMLIYLYLFEEQ